MIRMMVGLMGSAAFISISSNVMPIMDSRTMARSSWFHLGGWAGMAQCQPVPPPSTPALQSTCRPLRSLPCPLGTSWYRQGQPCSAPLPLQAPATAPTCRAPHTCP